MKWLAFILFTPAVALAEIARESLALNVRQEQIQQSKLNSRTSDGRRDRSVRRVRVLDIDARCMGPGQPEPAHVRWFFIGKSPVDGSFDYYSHGARDIVIPRHQPLRIRIVSDPLRQDQYVEQEFQTSVLVTAGSIPQGWVLSIFQSGKLVTSTASEPGLIEWMKRNPPPTPPAKK